MHYFRVGFAFQYSHVRFKVRLVILMVSGTCRCGVDGKTASVRTTAV